MKHLLPLLLITTHPTNPLLGAEPLDETFSATVRGAWTAGTYTYLDLERPDGQHVNVVTLGVAPHQGIVDVHAFARARHFTSQRLGRRFDDLLFSAVHPHQEPNP